MKVTISDISEKTGLSASTISRVLSGKGYAKQETRNIVEAAAKELGYWAGKQKKENDVSRVVLILVEDITNLFYFDIIRGIDQALEPQNCKVFIYNSDGDTHKEEEYIAFADDNNFYGVIMVTATETKSLVKLLDRVKIPVIMVNRYLRSRDCDAVCIDNYRGGYMATQYLLDMGHTRIMHLTGPVESSASDDRLRGFRDALTDRNIPFHEDLVYHGNLKRDKGYEFADYYLEHRHLCTALFCANDIMARAFIARIQAKGVRVPEDISVIAFDETLDAICGDIQITNVGKSPFDMGGAAAELLVSRTGNPDGDVRKVIFSPQLNILESVRQLDTPTALK